MSATAWHTLPVAQALRELGARPEGLTAAEARDRLQRYGANALRAAPPRSALKILLDQLRGVVVLLLIAAAVIALLLGDLLESAAIAAVLLLNTGLGFFVELRARRAMDALLRFQVPRARALRDGARVELDASHLVPGDVVLLEAGDAVPADARLLEAWELQTNEAPITGESMPVEKDAARTCTAATPLPDRRNLVFTGTIVATGSARAVVVATAMATELGRIGGLLGEIHEEETPLERRLDMLGRRLAWITLAVAVLVTGFGVLRGASLGVMLEIGVALAIAAVPEGLPAVATIALAVGLRRMARRRALVRRLHAVEALGSTTVVCTDKTGTLTTGQMTVTRLALADLELEVSGVGYAPEGELRENGAVIGDARHPALEWALRIATLASRAELVERDGDWHAVGDPTDAALLVLARKRGLDAATLAREWPLAGELPFSSRRRYTASLHTSPDGVTYAFVKGSPARVLDMCSHVHEAGGARPLDETLRKQLGVRNDALAARGLRVIALAYGRAVADGSEPRDLTFVALAALMDAPAAGVAETIRDFAGAGIRVLMITGDQAGTAAAIARELGIATDAAALDSSELPAIPADELAARLASAGAVSRASPEDKLLIVEALQRSGEIVAMLGDGVNDAAALKRADVGVAMGRRGTDVARQVAAVVLQDDRFPTIAAAVEEGRVIFDNIRKFILYLFSCNLAEVLVIFVASAAGMPLPLTPLQLLWLNLVTDTFPALALALEPGEPDVMRRPPRDPHATLLSAAFARVVAFYAVLIATSTLAAFAWSVRDGDLARAVTLSFMTLALAQLFHLGNARSTRHVLSPARALANRFAAGAVVLVLGLQLLAVYAAPLARVLGTVPMRAGDWALVIPLALFPALVGQLIRVRRSRSPEPAAHEATS